MTLFKDLFLLWVLALFLQLSRQKSVSIQTNEEINYQKPGIFLFYSSLCSSSQAAFNLFDTTHDRYFSDDPKLIFYKVDMSISTISEKKFDIKAYPVIILTIPGSSSLKYDLDLNPEDLRYFIEKNWNSELPLYKSSKKLDDFLEHDYLAFVGREQKFPNVYGIFKEECFAFEITPCIKLHDLDNKMKSNLAEALRNRMGLKAYVYNLLQKNKHQREEIVVTFDRDLLLQIDEFKKNTSLSEIKKLTFEKFEKQEMDLVLANSSIFNEIIVNNDAWENDHSNDKSYSAEDISLNLDNEAFIVYKNILTNKIIFFYVNQENERNISGFKADYAKFIKDSAFVEIYPKFTHRIRKHMTQKELIGIVLFAKKKFYSNNYNIQFFVNQTHDLRSKVIFDTNFLHGKKSLDSALFFILDPEEDTMSKQLANFLEIKDDALPVIYGIRFRKHKDFIEKIKFKYSERYTSMFLLELIQTLYYDNIGQEFELREYFEEKTQLNANIVFLNGYSHDKLLNTPRKGRYALIIEYTTKYCRECLKLSAIINKMSKTINLLNDYQIIYGRVDVFENEFINWPTFEVPLLRIYKEDNGMKGHIEVQKASEKEIISVLNKFLDPIDKDL